MGQLGPNFRLTLFSKLLLRKIRRYQITTSNIFKFIGYNVMSIEPKSPTPTSNEIVRAEIDEESERFEHEYSISQKEHSNQWLNFKDTCYIYLFRGGGKPSHNIAAFDLDGTIIKPKSNKRIPKSATDWQFFSIWTKLKIENYVKDNDARFIIFTNQNGVGLKIVSLDEVQERIQLVTKRINLPCTVFMSINKDSFRKPNTQMFHLFTKSFNGSYPIQHNSSFYCGDAIGYPSHSDADIEFARSLELPFITPEKFIRGVKPKLLPNTRIKPADPKID